MIELDLVFLGVRLWAGKTKLDMMCGAATDLALVSGNSGAGLECFCCGRVWWGGGGGVI